MDGTTRLTLNSIDAHAGGAPLRLVVAGFPAPRGSTMAGKRDWVERHAGRLRRLLLLEPRGHPDLCAAILTEPVAPGSHAGLLVMNHAGTAVPAGHGVMAATTIALERGLLMPGGEGAAVVYDTPEGTIRVQARWSTAAGADDRRIESVALTSVPAFVLCGGLSVDLGARRVLADVVFAGGFFAIVDSESAGLPIGEPQLPELRRAGMAIARGVDRALTVAHPLDPGIEGVSATIFTSPPRDEGADLRSVTVFAHGGVDRSPGGPASAAILAVLDRMGLIGQDRPFVNEGLGGARFTARKIRGTTVGDLDALVAEVHGDAWITGEHTWLADTRDPISV